MAALNTRYQTNASGTQNAYTAFAVEQALKKQWENLWLRETPLLAKVRSGSWGKVPINGPLLLLPNVNADMTTAANGVADASELTALTPEQTNDDAFSSAQVIVAHYRGAFWVRASELELINNQRGGGFLQGKVDQLMDSFTNAIADDLASGNADSRTAVVGIRHVIATANTVFNIAQSGTNWAANVTTGVGAFSLDAVDKEMDRVKPRRGKTDLILAAWTDGNNTYGAFRAAIQPSQLLVNTEFQAKYGIESFMYRGADVVQDNRGTAGEMIGIDSRDWGWSGATMPKLHHQMALPGTDADEHLYNMFCAAWCKNPSHQWRMTGVIGL